MNPRRRLGLRLGALACLATLGLAWWPSAAGAEGDVEVGWWYRLSGGEGSPSGGGAPGEGAGPPTTAPPLPVPFPAAPLPEDPPAPPAALPPPASVPEGGLYVANDSVGPVAISALRFAVGQVGESRLTLRFADGGAGGGLPIVACPLLEGFQAVSNGAWRDRPAHDCERAMSRGTINADGSMSFVLAESFQQGGEQTLDIVLLPEPANGTPFSSPFEAVAPDALAVQGPPPARPLPTTPPAFEPGAGAPAGNGALAPRRGGTVSRPLPGGSAAPVTTAATGAGGEQVTGGGGGRSGAARTVAEVFDDRPWARVVSSVLLGLLAVSLVAASNDRVRVSVPALARLGGPGADAPRPRGVGRFARDRSGPPPALS